MRSARGLVTIPGELSILQFLPKKRGAAKRGAGIL